MVLSFIGMPVATQAQKEYLMLLGAAFAVDGVGLLARPRGDSNLALIAGFKTKDVQPVDGDPLNDPSDGLLVFGDDEFIELLDQKAEGWRKRTPLIIWPDELHDYVLSALAGLKSKELAVEHVPLEGVVASSSSPVVA